VVSYEENVKAVLSKVVLGEADAGVVYSSDVPPALLDKVQRIEIPERLNALATYPIAIVADAPNSALAQRFLKFVLSPEGQAVLAHYGLIPVRE
ncbi:MAG: molybdate ABC transporter substrate-binding protein, partial [Anaerolineae bacterium]|nr:molybdate ABC transporter substrate-binding protein [Anaerolineae bacterium]